MNLTGLPWFAKGHEADYIAAFRRVVGIFRLSLIHISEPTRPY